AVEKHHEHLWLATSTSFAVPQCTPEI
ncbi:hypothetical protein THAOC_29777, partial [Thalassiosira oceanica]